MNRGFAITLALFAAGIVFGAALAEFPYGRRPPAAVAADRGGRISIETVTLSDGKLVVPVNTTTTPDSYAAFNIHLVFDGSLLTASTSGFASGGALETSGTYVYCIAFVDPDGNGINGQCAVANTRTSSAGTLAKITLTPRPGVKGCSNLHLGTVGPPDYQGDSTAATYTIDAADEYPQVSTYGPDVVVDVTSGQTCKRTLPPTPTPPSCPSHGVPSPGELSGSWRAVADMPEVITSHTATLLKDCRVLVAGGFNGSFVSSRSQIFDPATNTWRSTAPMAVLRFSHTATRLRDGRVLITGGKTLPDVTAIAEIYDPVVNAWSSAGTFSTGGRSGHTATLLRDGRVLVAGGERDVTQFNTTEIYNPSTNSWTVGPPMGIARAGHTATLLLDGRVLVAGGQSFPDPVTSAEVFDPAANSWSPAANMSSARVWHITALLPGGKVLVAGGRPVLNGFATASTEVYDPARNSWQATGGMSIGRENFAASALENGDVLVAGGDRSNLFPSTIASAEVYDPAGGVWTPTSPMPRVRNYHTLTLLRNGAVLVAGGNGTVLDWTSVEVWGDR